MRKRGRKGGMEKTGCGLSLPSAGEEALTLFKYSSVESTRRDESGCAPEDPKYGKEESPCEAVDRGWSCARTSDALTLHSLLAHPRSPYLTQLTGVRTCND